MKKTAKKKTKKTLEHQHFVLYSVISLALLLLVTILFLGINKLETENNAYRIIEKHPNQACYGISNTSLSKPLEAGFQLDVNATDTPTLTYRCLTGQTTDPATIQGKYIGAYPMGAQVYYFSSSSAAYKFAEKEVNPLRYWGVDTEGQNNGIPQTSKFTFIVSDVKQPYYDAYSVKDNAVVRVSLPCEGGNSDEDLGRCYEKAASDLASLKDRIAQVKL